MQTWRRVLYRANVLTEQWLHRHAFLMGAICGGTLTLLFILH
jgi:hypothetical protein